MDLALLLALANGFFLLFWFALGAAIGSFLNVVVYRLPLGLSLSHPPSRCPACRHRIRWRDNVPVLGWLWLRGRCRDCRLPIAPRYPIVEALVGLIFLSLAAGQLLPGGVNLPYRTPEPGLRDLALPSPALHVLTGLHAVLFCVLVAMMLIDQDGQRVPISLCVMPLALLPVAEWMHPVGALVGLPVGALCGWLVSWLYGRPMRASVLALVLIGGYLGWGAVLLATAGVVLVWLVVLLAAPAFAFRIPLSPIIPAVPIALLCLLNGRSLRALLPWLT